MFFLLFLTLLPQDGFGLFTRAVLQAVQGQAAAAQDPPEETHGWRDGQGWTLTLIFFPRYIGTAPWEESEDYTNFTGKWIAYWIARSSTSAIYFCSGLFLGLCISCLCIGKDYLMLWGWTVDQGSLAFSSQALCLIWIIEFSWSYQKCLSRPSVFRHLPILTNLSCGSCDLFTSVLSE